MSYGLRIWGADGAIVLDLQHRITRVQDTLTIEVGNAQYLDVVYGCSPDTWGAFSSNLNIIPVIETGFIRCWRYVVNLAGPVQSNITLFRY